LVKSPVEFHKLPYITNPHMNAFICRFGKVHAFSWTKSRFLDPPPHPLAPYVLKRYAQREEVPLWWNCVAKKETGQSERVVRSWIARRTRNAFKESLRKQGFGTDGRPLPGSGNKADLFGTVCLSVRRLAATISYVDLVKQTDIAMSYIVRKQNEPDHRPRNNMVKGHGRSQDQRAKVSNGRRSQKQRDPAFKITNQ
jgi:hypothetical protein